ncbi:MAG: transposase [Rhodobacteraceae bacterium]|nr:transposase [Paracoccaceae bacterium]
MPACVGAFQDRASGLRSSDREMAPRSWCARPQLRLDFMLFCGFDLFASVPDATTHCRFRNPR